MQHSDENRIDRILNSLDGISKAEMPPFFYTRLKAVMENQLLAQPKEKFALKPVFLTLGLVVVLILNIVTLSFKANKTNAHTSNESLENFAKEYNLSGDNVYQTYQ